MEDTKKKNDHLINRINIYMNLQSLRQVAQGLHRYEPDGVLDQKEVDQSLHL